MTNDVNAARARAYLLGLSGEDDRDAIEREYFAGADALEAVEAAEELLIEDYLGGALSMADRAGFQQHYLASPIHQTRVETVRRLIVASRPNVAAVTADRRAAVRLLPFAAGLLLMTGGVLWLVQRSGQAPQAQLATSAPSPATPDRTVVPAPVAVFIWSLSPLTVRGAADTPPLVIPDGTDVVGLRFEVEGTAPPVARGRVVIRTVSGDEVWEGPTVASSVQRPTVAAMAEVPAARLRPEDYTVTVFEIGPAGAETERDRYFLRVRSR